MTNPTATRATTRLALLALPVLLAFGAAGCGDRTAGHEAAAAGPAVTVSVLRAGASSGASLVLP